MSQLAIIYDKNVKEQHNKKYKHYISLFKTYKKLKEKSKQVDNLSTTIYKYEDEINNLLEEMERQYDAMLNVSNYLDHMVLKDNKNSYTNRKGKEQQKLFLTLLDKQQREISHLKHLLQSKK